ncbi:MAG: helix-turn-helix transcriptional regulator [Gammaproteobacteria bacterium]|nr:helix-turn-helix transcriptional regulator [Gammaproteobacteria bacterium]
MAARPEKGFLFWRSRFLAGLEVVTRNVHVHHYRLHVHDLLEITWVLSGRGDVSWLDRSVMLQAGDAFLVAPREPHAGGSLPDVPFSYLSLHVPAELLDRIVPARDRSTAALPAFSTWRDILSVCDFTISALQSAADGDAQLEVLARMLQTLLTLPENEAAESGATRASVHPAVTRIRTILDASGEEDVPVSELASRVRLHERYLISLFKTATGLPPHQYLLARRLEIARRMLADDLPVSTVAAATGFTDQSHLTRHFKRLFGITPGAYQREASA